MLDDRRRSASELRVEHRNRQVRWGFIWAICVRRAVGRLVRPRLRDLLRGPVRRSRRSTATTCWPPFVITLLNAIAVLLAMYLWIAVLGKTGDYVPHHAADQDLPLVPARRVRRHARDLRVDPRHRLRRGRVLGRRGAALPDRRRRCWPGSGTASGSPSGPHWASSSSSPAGSSSSRRGSSASSPAPGTGGLLGYVGGALASSAGASRARSPGARSMSATRTSG